MAEPSPVVFKKKGLKKNLRSRKSEEQDNVSEKDDLGVDVEKLQELKELQLLKKRTVNGLNAENLLAAQSSSTTTAVPRSGRRVGLMSAADALVSDLDLGKTFSVETNRRDEDADMLKFIEDELAKRKGKKGDKQEGSQLKLTDNINDIVFNVLPEELLKTSAKTNEEMLSNQMLSGIPEVDLGIHEKIRNIEATEHARQKIIKNTNAIGVSGGELRGASLSISAPVNVSAAYVQHSKFNLGHQDNLGRGGAGPAKKPKIVEPTIKMVKEPVVVIGDEPRESLFKMRPGPGQYQLKFPGKEKATDDYHYEKFKKSFRK